MYLYFASDLTRAGFFDEASLAATTERHHLELAAPRLEVVADFLSQEPAPHADAHPVAKPVNCR